MSTLVEEDGYAADTSVSSALRRVHPSALLTWSGTAATTREVLPASAAGRVAGLRPPWFSSVLRRLYELSLRRENWDSYGGRPLDGASAAHFLALLDRLAPAIQSQPAISLTDQGGLLAEWKNADIALELSQEPDMPPSAYVSIILSRHEWEGPVWDCPLLEKWLWRASSAS